MSVFDHYARYYDLLYKDKNYAAEAEYVASTIKRFAPHGEKILEFGSGTGIHGRLLAQKGYQVTGIERSPEMVARAREVTSSQHSLTLGSFTCQQGDIRNTRLETSFDAVIALFHVISYQTTNQDLIATFQNACHHIKSGGLFLFDVWYTPAVLAQRPAVRVKRMEDDQTRIERIAEPVMRPNENIVEVNYTVYVEEKSNGKVTRLTETHPMRHFTVPEISFLAAQTGFTMLHTEEFLTGKEQGENTWGVCFILKKR